MKVRAIKGYEDERSTNYLVMAAHAGRRDRTGSKVHMAGLTYWKQSGRWTTDACQCSANGHLHGTLVAGADDKGFGAVTCQKCGALPETAAARNAKSEIIEVTR